MLIKIVLLLFTLFLISCSNKKETKYYFHSPTWAQNDSNVLFILITETQEFNDNSQIPIRTTDASSYLMTYRKSDSSLTCKMNFKSYDLTSEFLWTTDGNIFAFGYSRTRSDLYKLENDSLFLIDSLVQDVSKDGLSYRKFILKSNQYYYSSISPTYSTSTHSLIADTSFECNTIYPCTPANYFSYRKAIRMDTTNILISDNEIIAIYGRDSVIVANVEQVKSIIKK